MSKRQQLLRDHEALNETLSDLSRRANEGDWKDLDEVWDVFVRKLEQHLTYEEEELLDGFALRDAESRRLAAELRDEHDLFRRMCDDFGIQIQLHQIRASAIDGFVELLRRHAAKEDRTLYSWVESRAA